MVRKMTESLSEEKDLMNNFEEHEMVKNYCTSKMVLCLGMMVMALIMPGSLVGMESEVISENEVSRIRATFELAELYVLGEDGETDYDQAREYFGEVIKADLGKEASAWSCLWLSKISLDCKEDAQEYLEKARFYDEEVPFIRKLINFLSKGHDKAVGKDIFFDGVQKGYLRVLKFLLACGLEVDLSKYLHCIALKGYKDFDSFEKSKGKDEIFPLSGTRELDYKLILDWLLDNGADSKVQDKDGRTVLHYASARGFFNIARVLLERGADVDAKGGWRGRTSLHWAAVKGHKDVVEFLVSKGADVDAKDKDDKTSLHWAALMGHKDVVEFLVSKGADVDAKDIWGQTSLHCAAENDYKDVVEFLVSKGAGVDAKDKRDRTSLHCAAKGGHKNVVELLLSKGADLDAKDKEDRTSLEIAVENGYKDVVELLVPKDAKDKWGQRPLYLAAWKGYKDVVEMLLSKDADVDAKDWYCRTALHWATHMRHKEVVEFLVSKGADIDAKDQGDRTSLHWAAWKGYKDVVELLVSKGADVDAKDNHNKTALQYASEKGYKEIEKMLLKK